MKPEEKSQEPLKTPCRRCLGDGRTLIGAGKITERCWLCLGTGYEEKP